MTYCKTSESTNLSQQVASCKGNQVMCAIPDMNTVFITIMYLYVMQPVGITCKLWGIYGYE